MKNTLLPFFVFSCSVFIVRAQSTIQEARQRSVASAVTVKGAVTAQFGPTVYLQDATAGIPLFLGNANTTTYAIGDSLTATGTIRTFNAQVQLGDGSNPVLQIITHGKAKMPIIPKAIKINELNSNEGSLVKIVAAQCTDKRGLFYPDYNFPITTSDGKGEIRISRFTELGGYQKPQATTDITGVVGRFRNASGTTDVYQLFPRVRTDFSALGALYSVEGENIDRNTTLDVAAWNLTWFGSATNGPNNENLQLTNVKRVLDSLKADLYVLSEVANITALGNLIGQMPGFSFDCSPRLSGGATETNGQRVCFVYKSAVFQNVSIRNLLTGVNTSTLTDYPNGGERFWASGRLPFMMSANVAISGISQRIYFVGIHARANTTGNDAETVYNQRRYDIKVLRDTLEAQWANVPLMVAGDFNDDVDETVANIASTKETTYKSFTDLPSKYRVVTKSLSDKGLRTFMSQENVIDHIMISDEFFTNHIANTEGHALPFRYITDYATTTSDHLPVFARFRLSAPITGVEESPKPVIEVFPNPSTEGVVRVRVGGQAVQRFELFDLQGRNIELRSRQSSPNLYEVLPVQDLRSGLYILGIETDHQTHYRKIFIQ